MEARELDQFRSWFPIVDRWVYLNHAAVSPLSVLVRQAMDDYLDVAARGPDEWDAIEEELRQTTREWVARLINADAEEIALVPNTSTGLSIVASGLPLEPGDEVLLCDMEFPANVYPWMAQERRGVKTRILPHREGGLAVDDLVRALTPRTRVVAVSTVEFLTGFRNDLDAIVSLCHERGIYVVADGIQSLGVLPFDVRACPVDALVAGGFKWLMGPQGIGFLYCRRDLIPEVTPPIVGTDAMVGGKDYRNYQFQLFSDARRFEPGCPNFVGMAGLRAAVKMLLEVGIERIAAHTRLLTDRLTERLQEKGFRIASCLRSEHRSAIVSFEVGDPEAVWARLRRRGIAVSPREAYIRVSPHFYNTPEEIDRFLEEVTVAVR